MFTPDQIVNKIERQSNSFMRGGGVLHSNITSRRFVSFLPSALAISQHADYVFAPTYCLHTKKSFRYYVIMNISNWSDYSPYQNLKKMEIIFNTCTFIWV